MISVTALLENSRIPALPDLEVEHGLSLFIETGKQQLIFDTGASSAFLRNAKRLGVSLHAVDSVVLSHHHYDHGGGLIPLLTEHPAIHVYYKYCQDTAFYARALGVVSRFIGINPELRVQFEGCLRPVTKRTELAPGIMLLTDIVTRHPSPKGNARLFVQKSSGAFVPDPFEHELVLVIRESSGLYVFTGCAHRGIRNMIETVLEQLPGEPIKAVFGGFHILGIPQLGTLAESKEDIRRLGEALRDYPVDRYYTGHCTGKKGVELLQEVLRDRLEEIPTGRCVRLG